MPDPGRPDPKANPEAERQTAATEKPTPSRYSPSRLPWLRPFLSIVLVIAIGLSAYFLLYANRRVEKQVRVAYGELASLGEDVDARVDQQLKTLLNRELAPVENDEINPKDNQFLRDLDLQARIESIGRCRGNELTVAHEKFTARVEKKIPLKPAGERVGCLVTEGETRKLLKGASAASAIDAVLLVDDEGRVLGGREQLPSLAALDPAVVALSGAPVRRADEDATNGSGGGGPASFDPLGLDDLPRTTVAGVQYLALCVPLAKLITDGGRSTRLCGFVEEAELRRHAISLSPVMTAWLFAGTALLLLTLPYLKVRFMSPRERLRAIDMWMLAGSAIALIGAGVLVVLFQHATNRYERMMDENLRDFVQKLGEHFDAEIGVAHTQLENAALELMKDTYVDDRGEPNRGSVLEGVQSSLLSTYPFFEAISLTDSSKQIKKWMPRRTPSSLVRLDDDGWLERTLNHSPSEPRKFSFGQTFAKTTGLNLAIVSIPVRFDAGLPAAGKATTELPIAERTGAIAIAFETLSLGYAASPHPFGLALVTPNGKIAFRSDRSPRRLVPFGEEWERGSALLARVGFEKPTEPTDLRYRGRMYRVAAVRSSEVRDVTLVGFYDKVTMEGAVSDAFRPPLLMLGAIVLGMLGAAFAARWVDRNALDWFWPTRDRGSIYLVCTGVLILAVLGLFAAAAKRPPWLLYALLAWPPAVVTGMSLVCAIDFSREGLSSLASAAPRLARFFPGTYILFGVAGLASTVATPLAIVALDSIEAHREALQEEMEQKGREEYRRWLQRIETRWIETKGAAATPRAGQVLVAGLGSLVTKAQGYSDHLPEALPREPSEAPLAVHACGEILRPLGELRRFSVALASCWETLGGAPSRRAAHLAAVAQAHWSPTVLDGEIPPSHRVWLGLGLVALAGLAWGFVRSIGRRILGLELEGDGVVDRSNVLPEKNQRGAWLLLRPSRAQLKRVKERLPAELALEEVDLRLPSATPAKLQTKGALLVVGIERVLDQQPWTRELRTLIASERESPLLLVSEIDPLHYFVSRSHDAGARDAAAMEEEARSWAQVLARVERIRFSLPAQGKRPQEKLNRRIQAECRWTDRLRDLELEIRGRAAHLDWPRTVELIQDLAEPSYREQWDLCSVEERRVLRQLAEEGVVNPRCFDVLGRLRRRHLVRSDPRFRIVNESFRRFVLDAEDDATVAAWERNEGELRSLRVRGPLLVFGVLALALLLATQGRDMFAAFTAAAGVIPLIRGLVASTKGGGPTVA